MIEKLNKTKKKYFVDFKMKLIKKKKIKISRIHLTNCDVFD